MSIPFISHSRTSLIFVKEPSLTYALEWREDGRHGGRSRSRSPDSSSTRSSGNALEKTGNMPLGSRKLSNDKTSATSYGSGGTKAAHTLLGQPFAMRFAGGGKEEYISGSSRGYPATVDARSVVEFDFAPFWPVVWPGPVIDTGSYLNHSNEYGLPDNSSRSGGPLASVHFQSNNTGSIFYVLSDKTTVSSLLGSLKAKCSSNLNETSTSNSPMPFTNQSTVPLPEQALQYYRMRSVVLTLDGYNHTTTLKDTQNPSESTPPAPLPNGADLMLFACLNETINLTMPLVDANTQSGPFGIYILNVVTIPAGIVCLLIWVKSFKAYFGGR